MGTKWWIRIESSIGVFEDGDKIKDFYTSSFFEYWKLRFLYNGQILFIQRNFY